MKRVTALVERADHVCCRYRIEAFAWALAQRGWLLDIRPLEHGLVARMRQLRAAGRADLVILQRKQLPIWQLAYLRRVARRLVYDIDDAVFQRDSYSPKGAASWQRMLGYWATVQAADAVFAGNDYLGSHAAALTEPARVHVVPTCIEPTWYKISDQAPIDVPDHVPDWPGGIRLAWIGQKSTMRSLDLAAEHLAVASQRVPGMELRAISDESPRLNGVRVVFRPWSSATEAAELAACHVGISWLPDDSWSRGKCGLKVLQYMAAGLPVVANPLGMNAHMVIDGETGVLASTPRQWAEAIARLAGDAALRRAMGAAGRRMVEQHYSVAHWGPRFAALIDAVGRDDDSENGVDKTESAVDQSLSHQPV